MSPVKAAAVQIAPVLYSREGTVDKVVRTILELGAEGVQFATFPETVVPYYPYFSFIQSAYQLIAGREHLRLLDQAVTVPSAATDAIGAACRAAGVVVSIGVNERDGGTLYNAQLLFDMDGTLIQRRRKITPTYHERMVWGQGDGSGLRAVDSAVGRIGQLACWEHYNPLARYRLDRRRRADPFGDVPRHRSSAACSPSRRRSTSASMRWSPRASWSARRPGWMQDSRPRSPRTPVAASGRSRAGASPPSWLPMGPWSVSRSGPVKAVSSPSSTSPASTSGSN